MTEFIRRIGYLLNRNRLERELAADMEAHRELAERDGRSFGNTLRLREESRDAWGWTWIDRAGQDLRYASRILRKSPGFTLVAVLTLAVGIGVNVAAFGFFDLFALRPLPVRDPETIVRLHRRSREAYATHVSYPAMAFYREHATSLSAVLAVGEAKLNLEDHEKPIRAFFVTANYFQELGAAPRLGRMLDPARDEVATSEPAIVLSHDFWQARYAGDPSIIGKTIRLNRKPAVVIGVAARTFGGLTSGSTDIWAPIVSQPFFIEGSKFLSGTSEDAVIMYGRLRPGAAPAVVDQELRGLAVEWRKLHPADVWESETLVSEPGGYVRSVQGRMSRGSGSGDGREREMYTVAALAGTLVFLILAVACANLGSLLLARGVAREREIAIRISVGAGSARLVRQLFTESLVLAALGSIAGLALGSVALRSLMSVTGAPGWLDPTPDLRVIAFAIVLAFAAAMLFGLTPALQVARRKHRATFMRQVLIGGQVAASCVLLIVAALLVRALDKVLYAHPGFEYKHAIVIDPHLQAHGYSPETARAYLEELRQRVQVLPGVESVSLASNPPLGRKTTVSSSELNGQSFAVHINRIDPEFFQTLRIPVVRGRNLRSGDSQSIVISESLARRYWPTGDAVGQEFRLDNTKFTVVGIAGNARAMALNDPEAVESYLLANAADLPLMSAIVRTAVPPENVALAVRQTAKNVDADVVPDVELMKASFERQTRSLRTSAVAVSLMGAVALILACLGIIGLVAYAVSQRTREIGVRMALGATSSHVLSIVLRQFARPLAGGSLVGVAGAAMVSQLLRRQLYGVSHLDSIAYSAGVSLFAIVAIAAALIPARRALKVDPMQSLRHD